MTEQPLKARLLQDWQLLGTKKPGRSRLAVLPFHTGVAGLDAWTALSKTGELRVLFAGDEADAEREYSSSGQLSIEVVTLQHQSRSIKVVMLTCRAASLQAVFVDFIESVVGRIAEGGRPLAAALGVLEELFALIGALVGQKERAPSNLLGVIGELYVLRELVRQDPQLADSWQGPTGARHDFRWGSTAIEVKTHLRRQSRTVSISSIDQLQPPESGTLLLAELCLERNAAGDITFEGLLLDVLRCLPPAARAKFEARIRESAEGADAAEASWSVVHFRVFRITPDFPALTKERLKDKELPAGVSHVTYRLDLSAADAWATAARLAAELQEGVGQDTA